MSDAVLFSGGGALLVLGFGFGLPRIWRGEAWLPHRGEDAQQAAWARGIPVGSFAFGWMLAGLAVAKVLDLPKPAPAAFLVPYVGGLVLLFLILASISLFNVPKALVAPSRRREPGMLQRRRRR